MAGLVLVAARLGKGGACWLAARATGVSNRDALGIGTLMNARGLMELIIINIGLQRGDHYSGSVRNAGDHGGGHHADGIPHL
jgi:Kef-type K+ transport system membrane component KefB